MHAHFPLHHDTTIDLRANMDDVGGAVRLVNEGAILELHTTDPGHYRRVGAALLAAADDLDGNCSTHG